MRDDEWMLKAACRELLDPDPIFFPKTRKGVKPDISKARQICFNDCNVRKSCLVYAVVHHENRGVWGGLSETERRSIPRSTRRRWREVWSKLYPDAQRFSIVRRSG